MKKTSYIILALVILPFVLALTSPFWLRLYVEEKDDFPYSWMKASEVMAVEEIAPITNITMNQADGITMQGEATIIVSKGDTACVKVPENITDYVSCTVSDNTLIIDLKNNDDVEGRYIHGKTVIEVVTPAFDSFTSNAPSLDAIHVAGFDTAKANIAFEGETHILSCRLDSLFLSQPTLLKLADSQIGYAHARASTNLGVITDSSRIETLSVVCLGRLRCDVSDTNIGTLRLDPKNYDIDLTIDQPLTIDYGNND